MLENTMRRFLFCIMAALIGFVAVAEDFDVLDASLDENINHPQVPNNLSQAVAASMDALSQNLQADGYDVTKLRHNQVIKVVIPASSLFAPGSSTLKESAGPVLSPLMPYVRRNDNYKVLLAVHSDDTGDDTYASGLTAARANAVDEFMLQQNEGNETGVIPYGLGSDEPLKANNSIANRAKNRRVEIYFIPTAEYIQKIKRRR